MTYTKQEAFDTVARHLFEQDERSVGRSGECRYRGELGTKCAIGALIPDEMYTSEMDIMHGYDDSAIKSVVNAYPEVTQLFEGYDDFFLTFLVQIQGVHDDALRGYWESTDAMREALAGVAKTHKLSPTILETLSFKDR